MKHDAIMIKAADNVATALKDLEAGRAYEVSVGREFRSITVREPIIYGHKFAVAEIASGEDIIKYGEVIGRATADIAQGAYAHVHNIESLRGRGDLKKKGE